MLGRDVLRSGKIGDRARDAQYTVVASRRETERAEGVLHQRVALGRERAVSFRIARGHIGVAHRAGGETFSLHLPRTVDALADGFGALAVRAAAQLVVGERGDFYNDVDPIHERAGKLGVVGADGLFAAPAAAARLPVPAAFAGVHGAHEHEPAGVNRRSGGARDSYNAVLERLTHNFKHIPVVFGKLVEKQHAVVRERYLARLELRSARHGRGGERMVRRTEGPLTQYGALFVCETADAPDTGGLHRLLAAHVRQYAGETLGEHRLARARRADHEHVMSARGSDLKRTLDVFLPLYLGIVGEEQLFLARHGRLGGGDFLFAREMRQKLRNGMYGIDGEMVGVRRLARVARGDVQLPDARLFRGERHRERAAHRSHLAREGEFADHGGVRRQRPGLPGGNEDAEQDREIVYGAGLFPVGGREIHGDAADGKVESAVFHRRAHALARLLHGGVGQADKVKLRQPAGEKDLRRDFIAADALQAERAYFRNHIPAAFLKTESGTLTRGWPASCGAARARR